MRVRLHKLTDLKIEAELKKARAAAAAGSGKAILLGDGGGLTLQVAKSGGASWLFRYMTAGKPTAVGLGAYPVVSLHAARKQALEHRRQLLDGVDPLAAKRAVQAKEKVRSLRGTHFDACALQFIEAHRPEWKSEKHAKQWESTLKAYASPVFGSRAVDSITKEDVLRAVKPIWLTKNETATRLRGRIEAVLDWATAHDYRTGDNPARFKGHLEHLLAKSTARQREDRHHDAMPYSDVPAFINKLAAQEGTSRWALEFLVLTASRTSEVLGAEWSEVNADAGLWTIPKERMKASKMHRVPLLGRGLEILSIMKAYRKSEARFIFPSASTDKPLSNMAMSMLLRRMGVEKATVHGFRSSFRDWVGEQTTYDFRIAEAALAHKLPDRVAAAYARSDLYEKRFGMMREWEKFCCNGA